MHPPNGGGEGGTKASGVNKPSMQASRKNKTTAKKGKASPVKKFGGGGGGPPGGRPPNPFAGAGRNALLADINKGNAVKLKKVPDAEKSKEIGGDRGKGPAGAVVGSGAGGGGGGGRAPAPAFGGGGGGMFGELQAKLAKRR